ncbi:hypothetical protein BH10CYA1_BH10CYA1_58700 [soil metagenome]
MQPPPIKKAIPLILLGAGVLFVAFHILVNSAAWIKSSFAKIDHPTTYRFTTYDKLLHEVVKGDAVDYATLKKSPLLDKAVAELEVVAPDKLNSDKEKLCYWLNSYNMLMLKSLSDRYPIESPRKLGNSISFRKFTIGGDSYSVRDIIDFKLSPFFKRNPLLTFVVCGGAKGEPPLLNHALEPDTVMIDAQKGLDNFVNNPANTRYDEVAGVFFISPYFQRYDDYFVAYFESPHMLAASHMTKSVPAANVSLLKRFTRNFDWRLNDIDPAVEQPKPSDEKTTKSENKLTDDKQNSSTKSDK